MRESVKERVETTGAVGRPGTEWYQPLEIRDQINYETSLAMLYVGNRLLPPYDCRDVFPVVDRLDVGSCIPLDRTQIHTASVGCDSFCFYYIDDLYFNSCS